MDYEKAPLRTHTAGCTHPIPVWVHHEAVCAAWDLAQQDVQVGKEVTVEVGTPAGTAQHSTAQYKTVQYSAVTRHSPQQSQHMSTGYRGFHHDLCCFCLSPSE